MPGSHASHIAGEVAVPGAVSTLPAAQLPCGWQLVWLLLFEYCPLGQGPQARSTVADGALFTKVPGRHVVQVVHTAVLEPVLNVLLAQDAQVRSVVVEPSLVT